MKTQCKLSIIFPLSNPSRQVEATLNQVINWIQGQVIVATASPLELIEYQRKTFPIAQCNNSYIFPGMGLGIVSAEISRVSDEMLQVIGDTLTAASPLAN